MEKEIKLYDWSTLVITLSCNLHGDEMSPVKRMWYLESSLR